MRKFLRSCTMSNRFLVMFLYSQNFFYEKAFSIFLFGFLIEEALRIQKHYEKAI